MGSMVLVTTGPFNPMKQVSASKVFFCTHSLYGSSSNIEEWNFGRVTWIL